mgnify:CR=1 FL=1
MLGNNLVFVFNNGRNEWYKTKQGQDFQINSPGMYIVKDGEVSNASTSEIPITEKTKTSKGNLTFLSSLISS